MTGCKQKRRRSTTAKTNCIQSEEKSGRCSIDQSPIPYLAVVHYGVAPREALTDAKQHIALHAKQHIALHAKQHIALHAKQHIALHAKQHIALHAKQHIALHAKQHIALHAKQHIALHAKQHIALHAKRHIALHAKRHIALHAKRHIALHAKRHIALHAKRHIALHAKRHIALHAKRHIALRANVGGCPSCSRNGPGAAGNAVTRLSSFLGEMASAQSKVGRSKRSWPTNLTYIAVSLLQDSRNNVFPELLCFGRPVCGTGLGL